MRKVAYWISVVLFVSGLFHLVVFFVDGGPWEGPVSWRKAVTFGVSFGITLATVAWVSGLLRVKSWVLGIFTFASVMEVLLITLQAWRKVPSHFNDETPFDALVARSLAVGGGLIIFTVVWIVVAALRARHLTPSMTLAVRVGSLTFLAAMVFGAVMIARGVVLTLTEGHDIAYATAGTWKLAHGVAMHGVLLLPLLAWVLTFTPLTEARRTRVVAAVSGVYVVAVVVSAVISGLS
ncbi:hypothetical protein Lesp02_76090 [Lentzea sp. NBRC 105346]|uniref:hypothetical protein n=1 Tax=Lentzea sp. NBRC 105346 TaxID=3032205 RepID=UPI0024A13568|nr:hypothetical protein [Lentzea sp. NBRC 105346]GLZ35422.1 hypothetical protein Lesp02_76090 [Lentzea sp. NBRC 105346]